MSIIERALAKAKREDRTAVEDAEGLAHQLTGVVGAGLPANVGPTDADFAGKPAPTEGDPGSTMSAPPVGIGLAREAGDSSPIAPAPPGGSGLAREESVPVREALV